MKPTFKLGDLVKLKSGGPVMTIDRRSDYGDGWHVVWFDRPGLSSTLPDPMYQAWVGASALTEYKPS